MNSTQKPNNTELNQNLPTVCASLTGYLPFIPSNSLSTFLHSALCPERLNHMDVHLRLPCSLGPGNRGHQQESRDQEESKIKVFLYPAPQLVSRSFSRRSQLPSCSLCSSHNYSSQGSAMLPPPAPAA